MPAPIWNEYGYSHSKVHQLKSQTTNASPMQFEPSNTEGISYMGNKLNQQAGRGNRPLTTALRR